MKILNAIFFVFLLSEGSLCYGQNLQTFTSLDSDTLIWKDQQSVHFLLFEQSDIVTHEDEGTSSIALKVTHWLKAKDTLSMTWSFEDGIKNCPLDLKARFLAEPKLSDLNNNGIYEVWFIIQKSCKGDISPAEVLVVMVDENNVKYLLAAEEKLIFPNGDTDGGGYDLGDFEELSTVYQHYAIRYLTENYVFRFTQ